MFRFDMRSFFAVAVKGVMATLNCTKLNHTIKGTPVMPANVL